MDNWAKAFKISTPISSTESEIKQREYAQSTWEKDFIDSELNSPSNVIEVEEQIAHSINVVDEQMTHSMKPKKELSFADKLRIMYNISYDTFLKITQFKEDSYSEDKFFKFRKDMAVEIMNFDSNILERFEKYINDYA